MTPTTPTTETVMIDGDPTVGRIGYGAMLKPALAHGATRRSFAGLRRVAKEYRS